MYENILVPVTFNEERDTQKSLEVAQALCAKEGKITLLHVIEAIPPYVSHQIPTELLEQARHTSKDALESLAKKVPGSKAALITGHPGRSIVEYAEKANSDCIVLASHKPGLENLVLGSTADRVVRHARCGVHVVR